MTEEEKRQQKAMLLLEYQEAEENVAHLREKVSRLSKPFTEIATWLEHAAVIESAPGNFRINSERDARIRTNHDAYRQSLNFDAALAVLDELNEAQKTLARLAKRKSELGLK
jgi:hypothetical protein